MSRRLASLAVAVAVLGAACGQVDGEPSGKPPSAASSATTTSGAPGATVPGASGGSGPPPPLAIRPVAQTGGLTAMAVRQGDGDLYVTEQKGLVRRLRVKGGTVSLDEPPVLDLRDITTAGGEQGLLGITFSPDGTQLYVALTNKQEKQEVDRFRYDGTTADKASREVIITVDDFAPNHNGGDISFGPDGFLYYGMGDGGGAGDPQGNGQKTTDLLGDILRIDPLRPAGGKPYSIPPDNPFASGQGGAPEVFQYGLRNPWRFSFDRQTKDLWIADVGQGDWEEIDFVAAGDKPGKNFGWAQVEGSHPFNGGTNPPGGVLPIYEYDHSDGRCAVVGGYVYRGTRIKGLEGTYLFSDNCDGKVRGLRRNAAGSVEVLDLGIALRGLSSFGEDNDGELYALSIDGTVASITAG